MGREICPLGSIKLERGERGLALNYGIDFDNHKEDTKSNISRILNYEKLQLSDFDFWRLHCINMHLKV